MEENNKDNKEYSEFRKSILKLNGNRNHKIKNSYGVCEAYRYTRKQKFPGIPRPVSDKEYYKIIRGVNKYLIEELYKGGEIKFPCRMGTVSLLKKNVKIRFKDGKLVSAPVIDWDKTLKLWYNDKEYYDNKTIVYSEDRERFYIAYDVSKANFNNKNFYHFSANRDIKTTIKKLKDNNEIDAFVKR